jgi:signal transduction histidine kinase
MYNSRENQMTSNLRHRIRFGLLLLLLLPLGFYEARGLVVPTEPQRLNDETLQSLLISYQLQFQQRLAAAAAATQLNQPLPVEFSAYWQKDQQSWQGSRRVPTLAESSCPPAPGRIITHASAHRAQLYLCIEQASQKQLFLLNLPKLLSSPLALDTLSLALVFPDQQRLFQVGTDPTDLFSTTITASSPYWPMLISTKDSLQTDTLDASWLTTDFGWRLVLLQQRGDPHSPWGWLACTLILCLLLSWFMPIWLSGYMYHRFHYLTQAAAQIALGNFTFRLPADRHDELELINKVFNRMLDEIQLQKQQLQEQNEVLLAGNESLKETLDTVQNMQSERFVKASAILQHAELQILRQALKWPLQQIDSLSRHLRQQLEELDNLTHQTAIDRKLLHEASQGCTELFQALHTQMNQAHQWLDQYQPSLNKGDLGEKQPVQLASLLHDCIQQLKPQWQPQGHQVYIRCPVDIVVDSYPNALGQVINNLMTNSLQHAFAPGCAGEIMITVKQNDQMLTLTFRDNGQGIPDRLADKLFQPFQAADRDRMGNSLGLYLTRQLVQLLLKGSIVYQPSDAPGACFIITLPLAEPEEQPGI